MERTDPQDEYLKWQDKEKSTFNKFSRNVNPIWIISGFFILVVLSYLVTSKQISQGVMITFIVGFLILLFFLISRASSEKKELSEQMCKQITLNVMEVKRIEGIEFPQDSKVRVVPLFGSCYESDVITGTSGVVNKEVGVEVIIKNRLRKYYIVRLHPFSGIVRDILPQPFGLGNKSALVKDRQTVPVQFLDNNK